LTNVDDLEDALCPSGVSGATVVLDQDITDAAFMTIVDNCTAILDLNGKTLTVARVVLGAGADLTIRDTSAGAAGALVAEGATGDEAGIRNAFGTTLRIEGGNITAVGGGNGGAGIGGWNDSGFGARVGGTIIVSGGVVTATGGLQAAGIGGGYSGAGGSITISGGTVVATGGTSAAGVGGGSESNGVTVTISGGVVTALGGSGAAGIGGGAGGGSGGTITISGGTVTATGGTETGWGGGAGIGAGVSGDGGESGGNISITGGAVIATGGDQAAGIGGGFGVDGGSFSVSGGSVTAISGFAPDWYGIGGGDFGQEGTVTIAPGITRIDSENGGLRQTTLTSPVAPVAPDAPTDVVGTPGDGRVSVSWTAPVDDGGSVVTGYTVTAAPDAASCVVVAPVTSCEVTGLVNGTAYTFTVVATNAVGDSDPSAASAAVTPTAPTTSTVPGTGTGTGTTVPDTGAGTTVPDTGTESTVPTSTVPPTSVPTTTTTPPTTTAPVPVPTGGVLPALQPGVSQVLVDGVAESVEVFVEASTDLVLRGQDFELRLAGECSAGCSITTTADGRQVLELEERGLAKVSGEGFLVGTPVFVWLFSEPRFLGELTVNADGTFTGMVPLGDIAPGEHTLQVNGTSFDGKPRTANLGVVVNPGAAPAPGPGVLPATGGDAGVLVWVVLLTLLGGALVVAGRRRVIDC
jgi:hypothetical protein